MGLIKKQTRATDGSTDSRTHKPTDASRKCVTSNIQFTILFNHSYNYVNKRLPIFHYIKAQIKGNAQFWATSENVLFSPCKIHKFRLTDRQIDRQHN